MIVSIVKRAGEWGQFRRPDAGKATFGGGEKGVTSLATGCVHVGCPAEHEHVNHIRGVGSLATNLLPVKYSVELVLGTLFATVC